MPSVLVTVGANASWDEEGKLRHRERWRRERHRRARSRLGVKAQGVRSEIGQHAGRRALQPEAGPGRERSLHRAPECRGISACSSHSTEERAPCSYVRRWPPEETIKDSSGFLYCAWIRDCQMSYTAPRQVSEARG